MNLTEKLFPGIKGKAEQYVETKDTATEYGSGEVEVFATPAMIALMEKAAHTSIQQLLPKGFVTVGTEVSIKHIKATGIGKKVWAESLLASIEGKKLGFTVEAFDEDGRIGIGTHTRYIVEKEMFVPV
ncbi:MAG: thioesterase family protein [Bacteroidota bacterium]